VCGEAGYLSGSEAMIGCRMQVQKDVCAITDKLLMTTASAYVAIATDLLILVGAAEIAKHENAGQELDGQTTGIDSEGHAALKVDLLKIKNGQNN